MPFNPQEVAEITVNGKRFRDWESVQVHMAEGEPKHSFKFSVSEGAPLAKDFAEVRIKPGDHCTVSLGGELAITGMVETRQVAYTKDQHGVEISGHSFNNTAAEGSVMHQTMEWKNKPLQTIATDILKPFGLKFIPKGAIPSTPFPRVNVAPSTTAWEAIETLARQRGVTLGTSVEGNVTGRMKWDPGGDRLVEGQNILEGREVLSIAMGDGPGYDVRQQPGTNDSWGASSAHKPNSSSPSKTPGGGIGAYAPQVSLGEHPGNKQDSSARSGTESTQRDYEKFEVTITVQGWHRPSGGLWRPGIMVHVKSPMLIVDESLKLMKSDFSQDNKSGTRTVLLLTRDTGQGTGQYNLEQGNQTAAPPAGQGSSEARPPSIGE
jgi:prophage tail gpP-like protein